MTRLLAVFFIWILTGVALFSLAVARGWTFLPFFGVAWILGAIVLSFATHPLRPAQVLSLRFVLLFVASGMGLGALIALLKGPSFFGVLVVCAVAGGMIGDRALLAAGVAETKDNPDQERN